MCVLPVTVAGATGTELVLPTGTGQQPQAQLKTGVLNSELELATRSTVAVAVRGRCRGPEELEDPGPGPE